MRNIQGLEETASTADQLATGILRLLESHNYRGVCELTLSNQRRADIAALGPKGEITIVEIKSSVADFRSDQKWPDYLAYCDRFYFGVGLDFPQTLIPDHVGLIVADQFGGTILREPQEDRLKPARRKAVTLQIARLAAGRLTQVLDSHLLKA